MANARFNDPELAENIDNLESRLIAYESGLKRGEDDSSQVQFIFRYAHNLKSSLGMLGFADASGLLHKVESCFDLVRNGRKRATPELTRGALQAIDLVRANIQAPEGTPFPDATALVEKLEAFAAAGEGGDVSVGLPYPLPLDLADRVFRGVRAGQGLWVIDKLITTNIDENFFGMLPCFDQARELGELIDYHPRWDELPKGQPECVLRLLVLSPHDAEAFGKRIHDSYRPVRLPKPALLHIKDELPPDISAALEHIGFKPAPALPTQGPAIAAIGIGSPSLTALRGARRDGVLVVAAGEFTADAAARLGALDAGADAVACDQGELERELAWLETLFLTGLVQAGPAPSAATGGAA